MGVLPAGNAAPVSFAQDFARFEGITEDTGWHL